MSSWTPEENRKKIGNDIVYGRGHFLGAVCDTSGYIYTHFYGDLGMSAMLLGKLIYEMTQTYSLKDLEQLKGKGAAAAFETALDALLASAKSAAMSLYGTATNAAAHVALDSRDIATINEDARRDLVDELAMQFAATFNAEMQKLKESGTTGEVESAPEEDSSADEVTE